MGNSESMKSTDIDLFIEISSDISNNPDNYREAGKWLDNRCFDTADLAPQETELEQLKESESCIRNSQIPARFARVRQGLLKESKKESENQSLLSLEISRKIILVCWILTDHDAEKSNTKITKLQDWTWEPLGDITSMSRGTANNLWVQSEQGYNEFVKITRLAWKSIQKDNATKSLRKIISDVINLGIFSINWRNLWSYIKNAKRWKKWLVIILAIVVTVIFVAFKLDVRQYLNGSKKADESKEQESVDINKANKNTPEEKVESSLTNTEKSGLNLILSEHEGDDIFIDSDKHDEFGFRISGEVNDFINIEILFRRTNGLYYVSENKLENIFYPLIEFGERVKITSAIRPDKLGVRLKWHYLSDKDKSELSDLTNDVIEKAFYEFAEIPSDSALSKKPYNKLKHPTEPKWDISESTLNNPNDLNILYERYK